MEEQDNGESLSNSFGGYWGTHPKYPLHEWQYEVSEDYTRLGYWDWVISKLYEDKED